MPKWMRNLLVFFLLIVGGIGGLLWLVQRSKIKLPPNPQLKGFKPPSAKHGKKVSPLLVKLSTDLASSNRFYNHVDIFTKAIDKNNRPFFAPSDQAKWAMHIKRVEKELPILRKLMNEKGCLPFSRLLLKADKKPNPSSMGWFSALRSVSYLARWRVQTHRPQAAWKLVKQSWAAMEWQSTHCRVQLVGAMIRAALRRHLAKTALAVWSHRDTSVSVRGKIWDMLVKMESPTPSPMPFAFWSEFLFQAAAIKHLKGKNNEKTPMTVWPFWDAKESIRIIRRSISIEVMHARRPFGPGLWKLSPFEKRRKQIEKLPFWRKMLHYNAVGWILTGLSRSSFRRFLLRWHQTRCLAAAARFRALAFAKQHKLSVPSSVSSDVVKNPLTGKVFKMEVDWCAIDPPNTADATLRSLKAPGRTFGMPASPVSVAPSNNKPATHATKSLLPKRR